MKSCKKGLFCLIPINTKRETIWWGKVSFLFGNWREITHPLYLWSNHNRIEVELHHLTSLPRIKWQKQSTMNEYQTRLMNSELQLYPFSFTAQAMLWSGTYDTKGLLLSTGCVIHRCSCGHQKTRHAWIIMAYRGCPGSMKSRDEKDLITYMLRGCLLNNRPRTESSWLEVFTVMGLSGT